MRFFFRSKQFKIFLTVLSITIALSLVLSLLGHYISPQAGLLDTIIAPFKKLAAESKNAIDDYNNRLYKSDEIVQENDRLRDQLNKLRDQLVDYESMKNDNEFYKKFLEIKENNPDFKFCPAFIVSRDPDDEFKGFTVDVGSQDGIELYDPVITDAGLVGYVTEVGYSSCKITTILSPELTCGAYASRTNDAGVITGTMDFALSGTTKLYNLSRTCTVTVGDIIVTSGSGIFPDRLIIGTISSIKSDPITTALYAEIKPTVDFDSLKNVMILTSFDGE